MPAKINTTKVGVGTECSFLALGRSKSLNRFTIKITGGIKISVSTNAITYVRMPYLKSEKSIDACNRWKWLFIGFGLFQDKWICKNRTNLWAFLFFLASSFKTYVYTSLKTE
jgi:hypothetical protein